MWLIICKMIIIQLIITGPAATPVLAPKPGHGGQDTAGQRAATIPWLAQGGARQALGSAEDTLAEAQPGSSGALGLLGGILLPTRAQRGVRHTCAPTKEASAKVSCTSPGQPAAPGTSANPHSLQAPGPPGLHRAANSLTQGSTQDSQQ